MATYPIPPDEAERLHLLHALRILDTPSEEVFDRITRLVARILDVPIALVSLVDTDRQWFKSRIGIDVNETPRELAFCAHAIAQTSPLIVTDTTQDSRFMSNALVTGDPNIRFYAGVPLRSIGGLSIGTLCAIDSKPRQLNPGEVSILVDLAALVSKEMQMREAMLLSHARSEQAIQAMEDVEARFRTIFERAGVGIAMVAPDGGWLRVNDALCQIVGYSQDELINLTFQDITHPDDLNTDLSLLQQLINDDIDHYQLEKRYITKSGRYVWIQLIVTKKLSENGELEYFISIIKNVQEQKEAEASLAELHKDLENRVETRTRDLQLANEMLSASIAQQLRFEQELRRREAELQMVLQNANDAYVCIDHHGVIRDWNQQAEHTFGWSREEAIGRPLDETIIPASMREAHRRGLARYLATGKHHVLNQHIELTAVRRDGMTLPVEVRISPLFIDGKTIFSAFLHDITERKQAEAIREYEATHDSLTGLHNRRGMFNLLPEAIARAKRTQTSLALLYIDLDGFKQINDTHGHDSGDHVLRVIGTRLQESIRQTDTAVRLGGDEFTILLENIKHGTTDADIVAHKILEAIQQPIQLDSTTGAISASIGIAVYHADNMISADQLLSQADSAMYEAKNAGKARVCVHK
ncbi:PAS domain S-box protein [Aeromonas rivipollensis]|uniref:PAS domain S-box protein n=1 Tax=Aeromonas rivipollensis TaxID=948519 RepID=A0ABX0CX37_9GAMM|nr:PAS domain S-box protein [Aeromonas rivipollensis]NEX87281.1 PAS domain S-box protein [Aeromonas rivipollensis]NEY04250.1 PAS domain S-box protein [Aeromonas rivipollensis]